MIVDPGYKALDEDRVKRPRPNWVMIVSALLLLAIGVLFVRSACSIRTGAVHDIWKTMLFRWIPLGILAHAFVASLDYRKWVDWSWVVYGGAIVLLLLVLVPGIGTTNNMGARRWLFGVFQPSEAAKFALVPTLAFLLAGSTLARETSRFWVSLLVASVPAALVLIQPDLGSMLPFAVATLAMIYVAGCAKRTLFALILAGALAASAFLALIIVPERLPPGRREKVLAVTDRFVYGHWKDRILVFVEPERDPLGAGWNRRQSEIAVGSGGARGKGYRNGTQNILGYLPASVSSSDFVFSVYAEETGYCGSSFMLALYALLLGSVVWTGVRANNGVGRLICTGVAAMLFTHVFVNIGMTVGLLPVTGIPLPLVSYGGTFTISTLALLGLAHGVYLHPSQPGEEP